MRIVTVLTLTSLTALTAACGGAPRPEAQAAKSKSAVSAAEAVGAQSYPKAALHLKMAKDQIGTADRLITDGDNEEADLVLQRAEADAELALALAREEKQRVEAQEALKKVQELKEDK
jgi:hypothetical protein